MKNGNSSANPTRTVEHATEALEAIFGKAAPETIFSTPEHVGEDLVITAASWERAGGFGFGAGGDGDGAGGSGAGGGGASQGRPVAVIRVGSHGVDVAPVVDFTKIGITVLLGAVGVWRALRR